MIRISPEKGTSDTPYGGNMLLQSNEGFSVSMDRGQVGLLLGPASARNLP